MKETKWSKPLRRSAIHIVEHLNMKDPRDNGIYVGISYPQPYPQPSDEGGLFVKIAEPRSFTEKGMDKFADALDTMMSDWLEDNRGRIARKAKEFSRGK